MKKITDAEEIRIRALVAGKTGLAVLIENIDPDRLATAQDFIDILTDEFKAREFRTQEFRDKAKQWSDVFDAVVQFGLSMKPEYMLCPFGVMTYSGYRYVAEMIKNKDGDQLFGELNPIEGYVVSLKNTIAHGKLSFRSNGIYLADLKFVPQTGRMIEEMMWQQVVIPKPMVTGVASKKLKIYQDCTIQGFYFKPVPAIAKS